ncbi:MAG: META domain-containing protein, partial [Methanocorpusculum sp.]|nr:META domain-containing protein [Methanocorpusculum sp.]
MKKTALVLLALVLVGGIVAAGCIGGGTTSGKPDGSWVLDSNKNITLIIDGGSFSGNSGVNQYFGKITADNGKIEFGTIGSTMMAGPEDAMKAESEYLAALENVTGYKIVDGKLVLTDKNGKTLLTFSKAPATPVGSWVIANTDVTLSISKDGSFNGYSYVNSYFGNAVIGDGKIEFGEFASTLMAGPEEDMKKETEFFAALENVTGFKIADGKLVLTDKDGKTVLTFEKAPIKSISDSSSWVTSDG